MIPFTSALFALRCHIFDMLPAGLVFLAFSYGLVIRSIFSSSGDTSSGNGTSTGVEDLTYNFF